MLQAEIGRLIVMNPYGTPDSFVFFSPTLSDRPIDQNIFIKGYYRALEKIGIDEQERRRRKLVFHSHRHFVNTLFVNSGLPLYKIQSQTGHLTDRMTEHYFHLDTDEMADIRRVQNSLFELPAPDDPKPEGVH